MPIGAGWLHEPKLDGYRLQIVKQGSQVRLYSRGGNDWERRLPKLAPSSFEKKPRSRNWSLAFTSI